MRTSILRVAVLLSLSAFSFPFFANGQEADAVPSIVANEAGARLALKEKNSVFSIDLSANVPKSLHATLVAMILSPDDGVFKVDGGKSRTFRVRHAVTFSPLGRAKRIRVIFAFAVPSS